MAGRTDERRWYELRDVEVADSLKRMRITAVPYDVWTNTGWYHERVMAHAPDKSCREAAAGLPLLLFHNNARFPIGRSVKWALDDPDALIGEWELDTADELAQEAARKARDGFLRGASIGFMPIRSERVFNDEDAWDTRVSREESYMQVTRHEIRLLEVSLTPTPAYADAGVTMVRDLQRTSERPDRPGHGGMCPQTRRQIAELAELLERVGYRRT